MLPRARGGITQASAHRRSAELWRIGLLTVFAGWLGHPFLTSRLIGGGDAWWYANMLRDFLNQVRSGIFPVWTGQTEFAFNGAVYPLRAAPFYQHLAGLLDLLTWHRLDAVALQNATVFVSILGGSYLTYYALCRLAPAQRNLAAVLAALYAACPGVLGLIPSMDLYMSGVATPFLPLVTCGLALSLRDGGLATPKLDNNKNRPSRLAYSSEGGWQAQRMIVIGLALTWYAHAPLAAWLTLITAAVQAIRLALDWRNRDLWWEIAGGALLFAGLAAYVFVSVASLRGADSAGIVPYSVERWRIFSALRSAFPGCLLPLQTPAANLSDLQLGYSLWAVLVAGCAASLLPGKRRFVALAAPAVALGVLLFPIPGLSPRLWNLMPESVATLTWYWPMHRLYPLLAALALPLGMVAIRQWLEVRAQSRGLTELPIFGVRIDPPFRSSAAPQVCSSVAQPLRRSALSFLPLSFGILAIAWSCWEAAKIVETVRLRTATAPETAIKQLPENAPLMNHAYGLSLALPPYFSNGVMDPWFELRVLDDPQIVQDNAMTVFAGREVPWSDFIARPDLNPGVWNLAPQLVLQPRTRQLLLFDFGNQPCAGTLQIEGEHFFRQYVLPASGQPLAFGGGPKSAHWIPLWTTAIQPEKIRLRFIPNPGTVTSRPPVFARYKWYTVDPQTLPLRIDSLSPLRLTVTLEKAGLLETFRMHFPGYRAEVDGKSAAVERSLNGLVAVPLSAGTHTVAIDYRPPWKLRLALMLSAATWLSLIGWSIRKRVRRSGFSVQG